MAELRQAKLLPGGALHIPAPSQIMGLPNYSRVVVFEWPLPDYEQLSHRGVAHFFSNGEGNPSNSYYYFKTWCQFHGRYHFYIELIEAFHGNAGGGQFQPLVPVAMIGQHPFGDIEADDDVGGLVNEPVLEGDANGGGGSGDANGGGGGGIHHCTGMINNVDDFIFWDIDGAHQRAD